MNRNIKSKKQFYNKYVNRKVYRTAFLSIFLIVVMSCFVMHDSFVYNLPFHYILFTVLGVLTGKIYYVTNRVHFNKEEEIIELQISKSAVVVMLLTLFIRYFGGSWILRSLNVIWYSDALYLFFIGLYLERILIILKQIDEMVYHYLLQSKEKSNLK